MTTQTATKTVAYLNGQQIKLDPKKVIGVGGEASVFRHKDMAAKIYLMPTQARSDKLHDLLANPSALPQQVIGPQKLVYGDQHGTQAIGFTMPLLDSAYTELRSLANKKYRARSGLTAREVSALFLKAHGLLSAIHAAGMVVGDLNDLNLMFAGDDLAFIDVDSFQFGPHPCMVGTEDFLDPALYGQDLSRYPQFAPENDWYAFAVLLFKSLLLTHPYGGVHPTLRTLPQRAQAGVSVFSPEVKYPKIAYPFEVLSDDLAHLFESWFNGRLTRNRFPESALADYLAELHTCQACGAAYPQSRKQCPHCTTTTQIPVQTVPGLAAHHILLDVAGPLVAWQILGDQLHAVAHENQHAVYYLADERRILKRMPLFKAIPDAAYAFMDTCLVVAPNPAEETLLILDISGDTPRGLTQTTTDIFGGKQAIFGESRSALYRVAGGYLLRGSLKHGEWVESRQIPLAEQQTDFRVDAAGERVLGYFRTLNHYQYWLYDAEGTHELNLTPLERRETLVDWSARFSNGYALVIRHTRYQGAERIRLDEITPKGVINYDALLTDREQILSPEAYAYAPGMVLYPTDAGITQLRLDTLSQKHFTQTEPFMRGGESLAVYQGALLSVTEGRVFSLSL